MLTIAKLTLQEMLRKRIFLVALVLTSLFLVVYGLGIHLVFRESEFSLAMETIVSTQLLSAGLFMASFIVAFLVIFTAVGTVSSELENGTLQTIIVKPLKRWKIIVGKYIGIGLVIAVYCLLVFAVIMLLNRNISIPLANQVKGAGIFCLQGLVLLSLVILGSTLFSTLNNGIIMVVLYGIGMIGGVLEQVGSFTGKEQLINIGIITSLMMPLDALYRKMLFTLFVTSDPGQISLLTGQLTAGNQPSIWMLVYTLFYGAISLWGAAKLFTLKDA
jgi:ABC-type transport system involved in multi-copper enzyme maturation permease subunit